MPPKLSVYSLPQGRITFEWWEPLSIEEVEDIQAWMKIVERQIVRNGTERPASEPAGSGGGR